jgi:glycerol-3-phosphate dehydrogenase
MFAGLRPLVKRKSKKTAALSRDHLIKISDAGLITITGGKWTTYRKMAEDVVDLILEHTGLKAKASITRDLRMIDADSPVPSATDISDTAVSYFVKEEMAMTLEDILSRRTRLLLLNARSAIQEAPNVGEIMSKEFNWAEEYLNNEINTFKP